MTLGREGLFNSVQEVGADLLWQAEGCSQSPRASAARHRTHEKPCTSACGPCCAAAPLRASCSRASAVSNALQVGQPANI